MVALPTRTFDVVFLTVTVTLEDSVCLPAASLARAVSMWEPLLAALVSQTSW